MSMKVFAGTIAYRTEKDGAMIRLFLEVGNDLEEVILRVTRELKQEEGFVEYSDQLRMHCSLTLNEVTERLKEAQLVGKENEDGKKSYLEFVGGLGKRLM